MTRKNFALLSFIFILFSMPTHAVQPSSKKLPNKTLKTRSQHGIDESDVANRLLKKVKIDNLKKKITISA